MDTLKNEDLAACLSKLQNLQILVLMTCPGLKEDKILRLIKDGPVKHTLKELDISYSFENVRAESLSAVIDSRTKLSKLTWNQALVPQSRWIPLLTSASGIYRGSKTLIRYCAF